MLNHLARALQSMGTLSTSRTCVTQISGNQISRSAAVTIVSNKLENSGGNTSFNSEDSGGNMAFKCASEVWSILLQQYRGRGFGFQAAHFVTGGRHIFGVHIAKLNTSSVLNHLQILNIQSSNNPSFTAVGGHHEHERFSAE